MSNQTRTAIILTLACAFALLNYTLHYSHGGLTYDEGDYLKAVRSGFVANWFDTDDISIGEFINLGLAAVRGEADRGELSRTMRDRESSAFYRHQHPPLAFYPAIVVQEVAPDLDPEYHLRISTIAFVLFWLILMGFLGLKEPGLFPSWIVLIPASANFMASVHAFNMHVPFGLLTLSFFLAWYAFEKEQDQRWLRYTALAFLAGALCSVEYGTFLLALLGLWLLIDLIKRRREWRAVLARRMKDVGWTVMFFGVLWPAGVVKLGIAKAYVFQAYIAIFRLRGSDEGLLSFRDVIDTKWTTSPLEILLFLGAIGGMLWAWPKTIRKGSLFVATTFVLAVGYLQLSPTLVLRWYMFPAFALAFGFFLYVLSERTGATRTRFMAISCAAAAILFGTAQLTLDISMGTGSRDLRDAILDVSQEEVPIIVEQEMNPAMTAYLPNREITGYHEEDLQAPAFKDSLTRWSGRHILVLPTTMDVGHPGRDTISRWVVYSPTEAVHRGE